MTRERTLWLIAVLSVSIQIIAWLATRDAARRTEIELSV